MKPSESSQTKGTGMHRSLKTHCLCLRAFAQTPTRRHGATALLS